MLGMGQGASAGREDLSTCYHSSWLTQVRRGAQSRSSYFIGSDGLKGDCADQLCRVLSSASDNGNNGQVHLLCICSVLHSHDLLEGRSVVCGVPGSTGNPPLPPLFPVEPGTQYIMLLTAVHSWSGAEQLWSSPSTCISQG